MRVTVTPADPDPATCDVVVRRPKSYIGFGVMFFAGTGAHNGAGWSGSHFNQKVFSEPPPSSYGSCSCVQVVAGAVLIRDQFGNGVGDISIDICRSDGGEVVFLFIILSKRV